MIEANKLYAQAVEAFNQRQWASVIDVARQLLPQAPEHAGLHYVTGIAALELGAFPLAATHLSKAGAIEPGNSLFAAHYARALSSARMTRDSLAAADRAMALAPEDANTLDTIGVVYFLGNAHAKAIGVFEKAIELAPKVAQYRFNFATALIATGAIKRAEAELEASISLAPDLWPAYLTLSQVRKQTAASNHVELLQQRLSAAEATPRGSMYAHLALAKEYEDLSDYPRSFEHLTLGKKAGGSQRNYTSNRDDAIIKALMMAFPQPEALTSGDDPDEPIFIIGMPRSGTTLVERIVSSHPDVYSAGELQNFSLALKQASGSRTPHLLDPITIGQSLRLDWAALGQAYIRSTRPATGKQPRFIDKLPHNFLYVGFIARALPKAKIICLHRNPMDTCLSNFRQLFAQTSPYYDYSYDLLDTGRYYVLFNHLMAHWKRVLPGRILEVNYEELVDNQEAGSRTIIDYCGLPWDDACLNFHENAAPVATASAVQVREPMYRSALNRWRRYEPQLGELMALLRSEGISID